MKKIFLNHKSNFKKEEYLTYLKELQQIEFSSEIILCPSTCYLAYPISNKIKLGSQNVSTFQEGSHTGEIAASQLKSLGVSYCLVGHYEQRKEEREEVHEKIKHLLEEKITPVFCIASLEELEQEFTLVKQNKIIIAYEPPSSIGTGTLPDFKELNQTTEKIKEIFPENTLIYGGSVNEKNIETLKTIKNIDGYLLGNLSLGITQLEKFLQVLEK